MMWEEKNHLQMNSTCGYMHNYCNKIVYIHIFTATNLGYSWAKICIYVHFFYFRLTDVSALTYIPLPNFWLSHRAQRKLFPVITPKTHENPSFSPFLATKYIYHLKFQINLSKKNTRQQPWDQSHNQVNLTGQATFQSTLKSSPLSTKVQPVWPIGLNLALSKQAHIQSNKLTL